MNATTNPPLENHPGNVESTLRALLVEDSADDAELVLAELRRGGFLLETERVETAEAMQAALARQVWDIVISDHSMPRFSAPAALKLLGESGRDVPFIVVSATIGEEVAVAMMKAGAHDFLLKDHLKRLVPVVRRELAEAEGRRQRTRSEAALQQERALLDSLVSTMPDHIYFKDREGRFIRINASMARSFGLRSPDEAIGRADAAFFTEEHARQTFDDEQRVMSTGQPIVGLEEKETWPDGRVSWVSSTKVPLRDAQGGIVGLVGISRDITEQKLAEEKIREQAALLDQASDAIYVRDPDGTIRFWNAGAERLYGWTAAEVEGRKLAEFAQSDIDQQAELEGILIRTGMWSGEKLQLARDGRKLTVFSRLTQTKDAEGRPGVVIAINTDITEKKQIEARFLQAQRLENLGALASGLAHDLNNVLAPILMATSLLKDRLPTDAEKRMLAIMEASAQRGADIVRQVLTFASGVKGERMPVQLRHLLREMVDIAAGTFPLTIKVELDAPKNLWPVLGDATQLHQILMNLCINARDAMPQGGRLDLTAENLELDDAFAAMTPGAKPGQYVCLKVTDTGTGISLENQAKIFDPFFTTKELGKGTGLGLATVLGITKGHGGFLLLNSTPGYGSCFEVYVPASPEAAPPAAGTVRTEPARGEGEVILVVDDEAAIRSVMARILEKHGYQPRCAVDGSAAMAVYVQQSGAIAAVITDMVMPGMDGPMLIRTLRGIAPQLPILGMTGFGERSGLEVYEALALPALLIKPFTADTLLTTLHAVLHPLPSKKVGGSATPWHGVGATNAKPPVC